MLRKLSAVAISSSLFILSPGIGAYDAAAKTIAAPQANTAGVTIAVPGTVLGLSPAGTLGSAASLTAPTLETTLPVLDGIVIPSAKIGVVQAATVAEGRAVIPGVVSKIQVSPTATAATAPKAKAQTAAVVHNAVAGVGKTLKAVEGVANVTPGSAHTMGVSLENALTGVKTRKGDSLVLPVAGRFASVHPSLLNAADSRRYFGQPAGAQSIAASVEAYNAADLQEVGLITEADVPGKYIGRTDFEGPAPIGFEFNIAPDGTYEFLWGSDAQAFQGEWEYRDGTFYGKHQIPGQEVWVEIDLGSLSKKELATENGAKIEVRTNLVGGAPLPVKLRKTESSKVSDSKSTPKGHSAPLAARVFATVVAALPAVVLGAPLILGGSILGWLIAGASLGMMAMPFFGGKTSGLVRRVPGFAVMGLGLFSTGAALLSVGLGALSTAPFWMGALVALGGWGLVRFGAQPDKEYFDEEKVLTAFFGGLAAVGGVGLVALGPVGVLAAIGTVLPGVAASAWAGWAVTGATWLSFPLAGMLLMHLPGWVGEGIGSAVGGLYRSVRGTLRTMLSIHRDTVMRDRLEVWTEAKLELNKWNFWKVAAIWAPILIAEVAMGAVAIVGGAVMGVFQAIPMFLWGASYELASESRITKFFASWNRTVFYNAQGSKKRIYNRLATPLIKAANSESAIKSWSAGAVLRLLQLGWLAYAIVATPFLHIGGFIKAFGATGAKYDSKIHRPGSMRIDRDDSPVEKPEIDKDKPVSDMVPGGFIATGLVALPVFFFGLPLLGAPLIGVPYVILAAVLAGIPLLPSSTPKFVRQIPGYAMATFGLLTIVTVPFMTFGPAALLTSVTSNPFWFGLVTLLSGFGFVHNITKLAKKKEGKIWSADDPEYIGGFLGALGILTGAGLAFAGVAGWGLTSLMVGSYLASGLLLMHLPKWFWTGVGTAFQGGMWSINRFHDIYDFWGQKTDFRKNMRSHAKYYLEGSIWKIIGNSTWLSLIWVPTGLLYIAEGLLSIVTGIAVGLVRVPLNWAWGATYEMDEDAKITRFFSGWARHSNEWVEGDIGREKFFFWGLKKLGLKAAMDEAVEPSGRPSLKAALAFLGARIWQIVWLAAFVGIVLPATLITGILAGIKNATGVKKKPDEDSEEWYYDQDDPDSLF